MKKKDDLLVLFGEQLKNFRKERGISQEELAFRAELDRTYISGLECGKRNPTLKILVKLAVSLNMKPSELLMNLHSIAENLYAQNNER
ncbi:MAG: helix-turn-helix domain-containing protein [Spirochaetaceae bacterium]|jgi:transcriptional regulator with XRE-family HTH domain|nr:helix-turn-helix domain-containing protein [Spirochaetaceae bacterium]